MHHSLALRDFTDAYVLASEEESPDTAVVFVHGFLGDAFKTWINFQGLIDYYSWWRSADLYFFAYDSFARSVSSSADHLTTFIRQVLRAPADWFQVEPSELPAWLPRIQVPLALRETQTDYRQLFLVGHSLGGLVLRKTVLDLVKRYAQDQHPRLPDREDTPEPTLPRRQVATEATTMVKRSGAGESDLLHSELRLFAPAILGARPARLKAVALRLGGIGNLARLLLGYSPSYSEMQQGSNIITLVREGTERFAERYQDFVALRASVLWAEQDDVVIDTEYLCDRNGGRMAGKNHISVCKPGIEYLQPLRFVADGQL